VASTAAQLLHAAEVNLTTLQATDEWRKYLELCQARLEQAEAECKEWALRCAHGATEKDMRTAQLQYISWKSRVETVTELMKLPGTIITASQEVGGV
jgi:hypothetical protein